MLNKGLDPAEFEKAFLIEDESEEPSKAGTPSILDETAAMGESNTAAASGSADGSEKLEEKQAHAVNRPSNELPQEVRAKLRKLETIESKYKGSCASL